MKKRSRGRGFPRLEDITPVDPEQFRFAVQLASAAYALKVPMRSPSTEGVTIKLPDGSYQRIVFTDVPINRAIMSMRDHFGPDYRTFVSAAMRFFALHGVWQSVRMKKWLKKCEDDSEAVMVSDAVFTAAASVPLNENGEFDEISFFEAVERIAKGNEASED